MTQQRRDNHSTEFGLWTRTQTEISSEFGYTATNIDWLWSNYNTEDWMLIEEKRHGLYPKFYQWKLYKRLDKCCWTDGDYKGFHLLVFENTSPDDGQILLDGYAVSKQDLIEFLQFEKNDDWYESYFAPDNIKKMNDWSKAKKRNG